MLCIKMKNYLDHKNDDVFFKTYFWQKIIRDFDYIEIWKFFKAVIVVNFARVFVKNDYSKRDNFEIDINADFDFNVVENVTNLFVTIIFEKIAKVSEIEFDITVENVVVKQKNT